MAFICFLPMRAQGAPGRVALSEQRPQVFLAPSRAAYDLRALSEDGADRSGGRRTLSGLEERP
jgi:hypothetical protein